jgi:hypothetical protein
MEEPLDKAKTHALTWFEQGGGTDHIGDVGRTHVHATPGKAIRDRVVQAVGLHVREKGACRALAVVVVVASFFEIGVDDIWILIRPVSREHNILAIELDGLFFAGFNL